MTGSDTPPANPSIANIKDSVRKPLPKRFYTAVTVAERDGGWCVLLDGRPVRTPARRPQHLPTSDLAAAVAAEWETQADVIDPARMPLTRIINSAIDAVTGREPEVAADVVKYAGSDLLLYRAEGPAALVARQAAHWDPVVRWAEGRFGGRFILAEGVMPVTQPEKTLQSVARAVAGYSALSVAALHVMTTTTGSALLALAHAEGAISAAAAWAAAHVDEDHQIELWGADAEAEARRASRQADMQAASRILALS